LGGFCDRKSPSVETTFPQVATGSCLKDGQIGSIPACGTFLLTLRELPVPGNRPIHFSASVVLFESLKR